MSSQKPEQVPHNDDGSLALNEKDGGFDVSERSGTSLPQDNPDGLEKHLARKETNKVRALRILCVFVLVAAATLVTVGVYLFSSQDEVNAFEDTYYDLARRLVDGFHANAKLRLQVLDQFSVSLTSYAIHTQQEWPFVTMYDFEARGIASLSIVGAQGMGYGPIVTNETRAAWEAYIQNATYPWFLEGQAYQEYLKTTQNQTITNAYLGGRNRRLQNEAWESSGDNWGSGGGSDSSGGWESESGGGWDSESGGDWESDSGGWDSTGSSKANIYDPETWLPTTIYRTATYEEFQEQQSWIVGETDEIGPYVPTWQEVPSSPITPANVAYNLLDAFNPGSLREAIQTTMAKKEAVFAGVWNVLEDGTINMDDDYDLRVVPAATVVYPIFDKATRDEIVGITHMDLEFGPYFTSVLPPNANGLLCVVSTPCGQSFSYLVNGETASYLGPGELYESKYEKMKVSTMMFNFRESGMPYFGVPVNEDFCPWSLDVYPTQELEDDYVTSKPAYYTLAVLGVFCFSCLMFFVYDSLQEKRTQVVMTEAVNSDKIVSELFPSQFKGQLYQAKRNSGKKKEKTNTFLAASHPVSSITTDSITDASSSAAGAQPPPMAQYYPNCTVFFADLAGFTAWSSSRSPADVFKLLETLYGAFDKLARKNKVFKIETIGDCYVAVTGLPTAQPTHALLMVKFARDCLGKMSILTRQLEGALGPDTGGLGLRVGLHSGPVTAGVLRGEKARFQLFGDTVNTTARMESNGVKGRIHVSQETADELIALGKESWVEAREEKIQAKGKGTLQTFFIHGGGRGGCNSSSFTGSSINDDSEVLSGDDQEILSVESVIADLPGSREMKSAWATQNFKRIGWTVELLTEALCGVVAERTSFGQSATNVRCWEETEFLNKHGETWTSQSMAQLCRLPSNKVASLSMDPNVTTQLHEFITRIAYSSRDDPFSNFERSCHTLMSAHNMLNHVHGQEFQWSAMGTFAVMMSSLLRDFHADTAGEKRIEEAIGMLNSSDDFEALRSAICSNESELEMFWGWVFAFLTLSADSPESLSLTWGQRWEEAFNGPESESVPSQQQVLALLEHVVLLSQSTHAFQHWDNYAKWTELHYKEKSSSHAVSAEDWFAQELLFFDTFAIPLAEKVDKAAILGVVGNEMRNYAQQNRREWEAAGEDLMLTFAARLEPTNKLESDHGTEHIGSTVEV